jgi:hypothetical protein
MTRANRFRGTGALASPDAVEEAQTPRLLLRNEWNRRRALRTNPTSSAELLRRFCRRHLKINQISERCWASTSPGLRSMQSAHAPAEEIMKNDIADKPHVTDAQPSLLEQHYELAPRLEFRREDERGENL